MAIGDFLQTCDGDVRIALNDGSTHVGRFRTDILSATAMSAYFYGEVRDMSLPIALIENIERIRK